LAGALAVEKTMWTPPGDFEDAVSALARGKYAREEFLRRAGP
jgi:hypothetical protein